ncbi:MAG: cohesin domain-containing protein [Anaerolineae bacterium]
MQTWTKTLSKITLFIALTLLTLLGAAAAWADAGARVYLQSAPAESGLVAVDVMAENVTDLYGLELHLKYDPAVLEAQDGQAEQEGVQVEPGALLPVSQGFVVANKADQAEGKVTYAITLLNPAPPVNGSGPIARLTFKTLQNTPSTIEVEQAILVSVNLQTLPVQTTPLTLGGTEQAQPVSVNTAAPVASAEGYPWWLVAAAILMLGLIAVGVVLGLKKLRKPVAAPVQTNSATSRRPSAFK